MARRPRPAQRQRTGEHSDQQRALHRTSRGRATRAPLPNTAPGSTPNQSAASESTARGSPRSPAGSLRSSRRARGSPTIGRRARAEHEPDARRAVVRAPSRSPRPAAELGPHVGHHAVGDPAGLEVALEGVRLAAVSVRLSFSGSAWSAWVSQRPGASAPRSGWETRREVLRERGEPEREAVVPAGIHLGVRPAPSLPNGASEARPVPRPRARRPARRVTAAERGSVGEPDRPVAGAPGAGAQKPKSSGASMAATGSRAAARDGPANRRARSLQRVVGRADAVEHAAEPAGAQLRVQSADLPEVARDEVRLVGLS